MCIEIKIKKMHEHIKSHSKNLKFNFLKKKIFKQNKNK